ncbi:MAG: hypothetical protein U9N54_03090 [candidate division Zixibacteria bacterium]|nr:hypothetical protein [candidate division Zixibacteria bacterium]
MNLSGRVGRQILLLSLLVMIVPLVIFPAKLGMELSKVSLINIMIEIVFYGFIITLFSKKVNLIQILQAAGLCFVYRLILGMAFGIFISAIFSMNLFISLTMGVSSYLPTILLHIVSTPFILKPVMVDMIPAKPKNTERKERPEPVQNNSGLTNIAVSKTSVSNKKTTQPIPKPISSNAKPESNSEKSVRQSGFEKAVKYIGEVSAVNVVTLVDAEGLLLANYSKDEYDSEDWAPYSLLMFKNSLDVTKRMKLVTPEKMDLTSGNKRVVLARDDFMCLMVVADVQTDDLLSIRVNQGMEIARRYVSERYSEKIISQSENAYV